MIGRLWRWMNRQDVRRWVVLFAPILMAVGMVMVIERILAIPVAERGSAWVASASSFFPGAIFGTIGRRRGSGRTDVSVSLAKVGIAVGVLGALVISMLHPVASAAALSFCVGVGLAITIPNAVDVARRLWSEGHGSRRTGETNH